MRPVAARAPARSCGPRPRAARSTVPWRSAISCVRSRLPPSTTSTSVSGPRAVLARRNVSAIRASSSNVGTMRVNSGVVGARSCMGVAVCAGGCLTRREGSPATLGERRLGRGGAGRRCGPPPAPVRSGGGTHLRSGRLRPRYGGLQVGNPHANVMDAGAASLEEAGDGRCGREGLEEFDPARARAKEGGADTLGGYRLLPRREARRGWRTSERPLCAAS